jgi:hypothetical protein
VEFGTALVMGTAFTRLFGSAGIQVEWQAANDRVKRVAARVSCKHLHQVLVGGHALHDCSKDMRQQCLICDWCRPGIWELRALLCIGEAWLGAC